MENEENLSFEELLNNSIKEEVKLDKIVTGKIIKITQKGEIFVDLGYKADGIIPKNEYSFQEQDDPNIEFKIGDSITAEVLKQNDGLGNVLLSYKRAKSAKQRIAFEEKIKKDEIFQEMITEVMDKGFVVNKEGIRIFIPLSLSGITREESVDSYKGKKVSFKIVDYEPKQRKIIGSVKAVQDTQKQQKEQEFWNQVELGKEYEGKVTSLSAYGAFVAINDVQGLLHVSELSWNKNANPNEILTIGQTILVSIIELDKENRRMKLTYSNKGENPWNHVKEKYAINDIVKVEIVKLMSFGAFAKLEDGIEGLIHISQICEKRITKPEEGVTVGQHVNVKIIDINKEANKLELSMKEIEGTSNEYIEEIK